MPNAPVTKASVMEEVPESGGAAPKGFLDLIAPGIVKFEPDHYVCGNTYRSVWAVREYPPATRETALLRRLGEKEGVTLKIEVRQVTPREEHRIIANAANRNRMRARNGDNLRESVEGARNLEDVTEMLSKMHRSREPLLHAAVFIEVIARDLEGLRLLQAEVETELNRSKINFDRLLLRQKQGFLSVSPFGKNRFKEQYERVLPAGSVANLFPFNYSGKTDPHGFYLGRDRFGSNVIADLDWRSDDRTNANAVILGGPGEGKSYLLNLVIVNARMAGKRVYCLDPEAEKRELTENLGGVYLDLTDGVHRINPLEPKRWDDGETHDPDAPGAFRCGMRVSSHLSFLRDFFRAYRGFDDAELDVLGILLEKLYGSRGITDEADLSGMGPGDWPILSDLYDLAQAELGKADDGENLYTAEHLRAVCLGLHSMCKGADAKYFNGTSNVGDGEFITFGVKGLLGAGRNVRDAVLFNVLSYLSNELLTVGNAVAAIDEFYLFLSNLTAVEYVRNLSKRVRKKDGAVIIASQNVEDFNLEGIRDYTRPLLSIPTHVFLFHAGTVDEKFYREVLQLEQGEYDLIRTPRRGTCLYKCGAERYCLEVHAPAHKEALFGKAGGR
ncbi:MAG: ATP-binding protein [Lachnospiraceae bacterium]|nr:ATP-binding protein [Lachnospiraceae bacterium]